MARRPRICPPGLSHHVIQRGNNRSDTFREPEDYLLFLVLLRTFAAAYRVTVNAYVLMTNHVHLILTPSDPGGLSRTMQAVGRSYVPLFNRRHQRTGTLWEGRFRSTAIEDERYFVTCHRYIELNPVRARMVAAPEEYRWSSFRHYAFGAQDPVLTAHPIYLNLGATATARQDKWRQACGVPLLEEELTAVRRRPVIVSEPLVVQP